MLPLLQQTQAVLCAWEAPSRLVALDSLEGNMRADITAGSGRLHEANAQPLSACPSCSCQLRVSQQPQASRQFNMRMRQQFCQEDSLQRHLCMQEVAHVLISQHRGWIKQVARVPRDEERLLVYDVL
jgi:hypothetical protein